MYVVSPFPPFCPFSSSTQSCTPPLLPLDTSRTRPSTYEKCKAVDYTSNTASASDSQPPPKKRSKATGTKPQVSKNTAVFVTHLPLDATPEEIAARFSKCGVLMEDDDGHPKVKMYADEHGNFNGEALIVYFMEDSVRLAESILDDTKMRLGDPTTRMRVRAG